MKYTIAILALLGYLVESSQAIVQHQTEAPVSNTLLQTEAGCEPAIDVSQKQLDIELDYFSRTLDRKHYKKAMQVYGELKKQGKNPKVSIHTWELYDGEFADPANYDPEADHPTTWANANI